ncbi:MAG: hypothetical protein LBI39_00465 [Puniceicoccales bacterium]|jgi:hypothetical protein|nr:hypothetical protein [Puniceicoccales bacterium]
MGTDCAPRRKLAALVFAVSATGLFAAAPQLSAGNTLSADYIENLLFVSDKPLSGMGDSYESTIEPIVESIIWAIDYDRDGAIGDMESELDVLLRRGYDVDGNGPYLATESEFKALISSLREGKIDPNDAGPTLLVKEANVIDKTYVDEAIRALQEKLKVGDVDGIQGRELLTTERFRDILRVMENGKLSTKPGSAKVLALQTDLDSMRGNLVSQRKFDNLLNQLRGGKIDKGGSQTLALKGDLDSLKSALASGKLSSENDQILATKSDIDSLKAALGGGTLDGTNKFFALHSELQTLQNKLADGKIAGDDRKLVTESRLGKLVDHLKGGKFRGDGTQILALHSDLGATDAKVAQLTGRLKVGKVDDDTNQLLATKSDIDNLAATLSVGAGGLNASISSLDSKLQTLQNKLADGKIAGDDRKLVTESRLGKLVEQLKSGKFRGDGTQFLATKSDIDALKDDFTNLLAEALTSGELSGSGASPLALSGASGGQLPAWADDVADKTYVADAIKALQERLKAGDVDGVQGAELVTTKKFDTLIDALAKGHLSLNRDSRQMLALRTDVDSLKDSLLAGKVKGGASTTPDLVTESRFSTLVENLENGKLRKSGNKILALHSDLGATDAKVAQLIGRLKDGKVDGDTQILATKSDIDSLNAALGADTITLGGGISSLHSELQTLQDRLANGKIAGDGNEDRKLVTESKLSKLIENLKNGKFRGGGDQVLAKKSDVDSLKTALGGGTLDGTNKFFALHSELQTLQNRLADGKIAGDGRNDRKLVTESRLGKLVEHLRDGKLSRNGDQVLALKSDIGPTDGKIDQLIGLLREGKLPDSDNQILALKGDIDQLAAAIAAKADGDAIPEDFVTHGELGNYASTDDLLTAVSNLQADFVTADALGNLASKSDLTAYATIENLNGGIVEAGGGKVLALDSDIGDLAAGIASLRDLLASGRIYVGNDTQYLATMADIGAMNSTAAIDNLTSLLRQGLLEEDGDKVVALASDLDEIRGSLVSGDAVNTLKTDLKNGVVDGAKCIATNDELDAVHSYGEGLSARLAAVESDVTIFKAMLGNVTDFQNLSDFASVYSALSDLYTHYSALQAQVAGQTPGEFVTYAEVFPHGDLVRAKLELLEIGFHSAERHMAGSYGSGMFFSAFGGTSRYEPYDDGSDFWLDGKLHGAVMGEAFITHIANSSVRYGFMLGYGSNRMDFAGKSINLGVKSLKHDSYFGAVSSHFEHINRNNKRTALNLLCGYSKGKNTSSRINSNGAMYDAKFNDIGGCGIVQLAQNIIRIGSVQFGPWGEARYNYVRQREYSETGAKDYRASLSEVSHDIIIGVVGLNIEFGQPKINPELKSRLFIRGGYETKPKQRHTTAIGNVDGVANPIIGNIDDHFTKGKATASIGARTTVGHQCELSMHGSAKFSKEYASGSLELSLTCLF